MHASRFRALICCDWFFAPLLERESVVVMNTFEIVAQIWHWHNHILVLCIVSYDFSTSTCLQQFIGSHCAFCIVMPSFGRCLKFNKAKNVPLVQWSYKETQSDAIMFRNKNSFFSYAFVLIDTNWPFSRAREADARTFQTASHRVGFFSSKI